MVHHIQNVQNSLTKNERQLGFDRSVLFGLMHHFSGICSDLLTAVQISQEFQINLGHDLASISEYTVGDLHRKMNDITLPTFDPFELENKDLVEQFHELVSSTVLYGCSCISRCFQNVKSADKAFQFSLNTTMR
jgi:hypothetical protein